MGKRLLLSLVFVLALATIAVATDDPMVGTWKLNVTKSKATGMALPKSEAIRIEADGNGFKLVLDTVDAAGKKSHSESPMILDGKYHSVAGHPNYDEATGKRVDSYTYVGARKKGGQEVGSMRSVISKDGKTMTMAQKGKNEQGEGVSRTMVYEKQ